jgi:hypothetical protein
MGWQFVSLQESLGQRVSASIGRFATIGARTQGKRDAAARLVALVAAGAVLVLGSRRVPRW